MRRFALFAVILFAGCSQPEVTYVTARLVEPIDDADKQLTAGQLEVIVSYLASDALEGRAPGYPGNDKATEFIAALYQEAGLKAVGDNGTYFQAFTYKNKGERKTRNTLALLEGTDLKDEIVVVGGHHDHLGRGTGAQSGWPMGGTTKDDEIYNGADDNASGAATVVALARAFARSGLKPHRSILFMTFSGEEDGLIGSAYYCEHPIKPMANHVAMLNLDMVGRNGDKPVFAYGLGSEAGDAWEKLVDGACKNAGFKVRQAQQSTIAGGDSDHSSFRDKGVPVLGFFTDFHKDYHQVSDHARLLDYQNMERIGRASMHIIWEWANGPRAEFKR
jgi:Zn-dependent M28 family amino/carboxypeptidase